MDNFVIILTNNKTKIYTKIKQNWLTKINDCQFVKTLMKNSDLAYSISSILCTKLNLYNNKIIYI